MGEDDWGFAPNPTKNLRFLDFPHVPDCMQSGMLTIERKREAEKGV